MESVITGCIVLLLAGSASLFAQDHDAGEFGVYGEYLHLSQTQNNFAGLGARLGFNVHPNVQIEGNFVYDFAENYTTSTSTAFVTSFTTSRVTMLHGMVGPKFEVGTTHARLFATVQGGFVHFDVNNGGSVASGFTTSFSDIANGGNHGLLYPGVGGEMYVGPVGIRLDVGDFIYWATGAHGNWDVRLGPQIRF
jgi:hypothetical protein